MYEIIKHIDLMTFDPKIFFKEYDFWKEITNVPTDIELDTSNNEGKLYDIKLITIVDLRAKLEDTQKHKYFIVAEEKYSDNEILKLRPYCRCFVCKSSIFSLEKYSTCRCCVGCLYASNKNISHKVVRDTRKYYNFKQLPFLTRFSPSFSDMNDEIDIGQMYCYNSK